MRVSTPVNRVGRGHRPAFGGAPCHRHMALSKRMPRGRFSARSRSLLAMTRLDRREFLGGAVAFGAAVHAVSLWARGPAAYPAPDREAMIPVPGGRVYVRVNGTLAGPRPPVVFLHGGPGGTHATYLDALALADERAVILYDQLDSGRSDRPNNPANWTVARFTDEVSAVARALGVRRWHVL